MVESRLREGVGSERGVEARRSLIRVGMRSSLGGSIQFDVK